MPASKRFLVRVYLVTVILRLVPVILARGLGIGLDDMFQYDMLARSLASGNGYRWYARADLRLLEPYVDFDFTSIQYDPVRGVRTSFRAPLYPAFLASVYVVSGTGFGRFLAARIAQAVLLGAPLAPLTYLTARRLLAAGPADGARQERAARWAAWIIAAYPMLLLFPLGLGTENLFFLLLLASVLSLLRTSDEPSSFNFLLAGFLLGLTALTRSVVLPFAGLAILWVTLAPLSRKSADGPRGLRLLSMGDVRGAALVAAALTFTILPWVIRNSLMYGKLTGIENSLGYNLYVGYHPLSSGTFTFGPSLDLVPILDDSVRDRIGIEKAIGFIQADPGRFWPLALSRLGHFFRLELRVLTYFYASNFFGYIPSAYLLLLAAIFGLPFALLSISASFGAALLPAGRSSSLLGLLFIVYLLPHVFILSEERFHLALLPFLATLAAYFWTAGWSAVLTRYRASRAGRTAVVLSSLAVVFLLLNWTYQLVSEASKFAQLLGPAGNRLFLPY
ncbi:MAG TPA: hypothetical protein VGJ22_09265 [Anaerolineales bacterium]|jgi:hypothetical protein